MSIVRRRRVLVVSAKGFGNVGDDIVSMVTGSLLNNIYRGAEIRFADLGFVYSEVSWADIVVLGGGGVLYDSSRDNVDNYLRFIDHAHLMGKKVIGIGLGVQGIYTDYGKRRYRETLSMLDLLIVRDDRDALVLSEIGVAGPIFTAPDLAFLLPELLPSMQELYGYKEPDYLDKLRGIKDRVRSRGGRLIGVSVASESGSAHVDTRPGDEVDYGQMSTALLLLIDSIVSAGSHIALFLQSVDDKELYDELKDRYSSNDVTLIEPKHQEGALASMDTYRIFDGVITSRYHGFILATLTRTPMIILEGSNSGKTIRTVSSLLPSLQGAVINLSEKKAMCRRLSVDKFSEVSEDEINTLIVRTKEVSDYIKSALTT